jgi:uncharacterized metal-binding protein YceD (DUF177 family)
VSGGFVLSRPFDPDSIPAEGTERQLTATVEERAAIAAGFGLLSLDALSAELQLHHWRGEGVRIEGRLRARLSQSCVVTLEPVVQEIDERFELRLAPEGSRLAGEPARPQAEIAIDPDADDPPDVYAGSQIDLGAVVEEQLALFIDPYPRAPGAELPAIGEGPAEEERKAESPFAALAKLKDEKPGKPGKGRK